MREITYTEAAREALTEQMALDPSIFVVGEGIGERGGNFNTTLGLYEKYVPCACAIRRLSNAASSAYAPAPP